MATYVRIELTGPGGWDTEEMREKIGRMINSLRSRARPAPTDGMTWPVGFAAESDKEGNNADTAICR